ncbi:MAG TPA: MFS transporter [Nitrososphaerales archaeon]|nr:MFS transporter [Nitrososphaerales archaeon]
MNKWLALAAVNAGNFVPPLDTGIMAFILPTISIGLRAPVSVVIWVPLTSLLIEAAFMPIFGRFSDRSGRKRWFLIGLALFALGSFLAGNSLSIFELLLYRSIQSFGAAFILANGRALIADAFPPEERGFALGTHIAVIYIATAVGTAVTGSIVGLTQFVGWRYVFYASGSIAVVALFLSVFFIRESPRKIGVKMDWAGSLLFAVGLTSALVVLTQIAQSGWGNIDVYIQEFRIPLLNIYFYPQYLISVPVWFVVTVAVGAIALLAIREVKFDAPLIDFRLFRENRIFLSTNFSALFLYVSHWSSLILLSFYLQVIRGIDPFTSGLLLTSEPLAVTVFATLGGWISTRTGSRDPSIAGLIIVGSSLALFTTVSPESSLTLIAFLLVMLGAGVGLFAPNNTNANLGSVEPGDRAMANGLLGMMRHTGQSLSLALGTFLIGSYVLGNCIVAGCSFSPAQYVGALHVNFALGAGLAAAGVAFAWVGREAASHKTPSPEPA